MEIKPEEIVENFLMAISKIVPEIIRKYDALNGNMNYEELKFLLLNKEASEVEASKRCNEGKLAEMNVDTKIKIGKKKIKQR